MKKTKLKKQVKGYETAIEKEQLLVDTLLRSQREEQGKVLCPPNELCINFRNGGVHFGQDALKDPRYYTGKPQENDGHILVIGSSGCCKTTGIILPTIFTWQGTFVAVDVKGDISNFCLRHYDEIAHPTAVIDFSGSKDTFHFDPFLQLRKGGEDELISNARDLALSIIPTPSDIREPFWIQGAQNILTAIILYAVESGIDFNQTIEMTLTTPIEKSRKQFWEVTILLRNLLLCNILKTIHPNQTIKR